MLANPTMTALSAIAALAPAVGGLSGDPSSRAISLLPITTVPTSGLSAEEVNRSIQLIDRVEDGSDFDEFRHRLWQAIQQRDAEFIYELLPAEGLFIGEAGPIAPSSLALEAADSPFWHSLEKMLAPQSCELEDYPGSLPDAAVWGCPNIASAVTQQLTSVEPSPFEQDELDQVLIVGRGVNVRDRPTINTSVVGRLSNEMVEFNQTVWRELRQNTPETTDDPIDGWTPVILSNQVQGYVYNRYVYHPQGPRALFELIDGRWQLFRILID
ncbi:MAG: SH3 domain-containing protein [Cyanobacteria bacterium P01_F01_bin.86]